MSQLFINLQKNVLKPNQIHSKYLQNILRSKNTNATLKNKPYIIVRVTPKDYQKVVDLFCNSYCVAEPTMVAAGLALKRNAIIDNKFVEGLSQGMSLMARCKTDGEIIGAAINTAICSWDPAQTLELAKICTCQRTADLLTFYSYITRAPNLWCRFCESKIYECTYLTTAKSHRGQGVGYNLLKNSLDLGKDLTYNVIRVDATSLETQKICEKLRMQKIFEIPYESYCDKEGKPIFRPPPPHKSVKVYLYLPHGTFDPLGKS